MIIGADRVITGDGATVLENHAVLVDEKTGAIAKIAEHGALVREYPGEKLLFSEGTTLTPGLVDMHVHLGNWEDRPGDWRDNDFALAYVALRSARSAFADGVTTLRDVSSRDGLSATMRWAAEAGIVREAIPRIIPCGNGICMTGGHGSEIANGGEEVDGPWELRRAIRRKIKNGGQWVKILTSKRASVPEFTQEELDAAADECHRVGRKIAVHSGVQPTIQMCIDAGFDTIEHGTFMTEAQARQMKEKGIAWVPTILAYASAYEKTAAALAGGGGDAERMQINLEYYRAANEAYRVNFRRFFDIGLLVGAGTDLSMDRGCGAPVARELKCMVDCGLEPIRAIRTGTANGAEILGLSGVTGMVREGLAADLLIVDGNPLEDIGAMRNVRRLFLGGKTVFEKIQD